LGEIVSIPRFSPAARVQAHVHARNSSNAR
jgi:hypothetical protein